jgi:uncharacterized protein (TIGR02145 family)
MSFINQHRRALLSAAVAAIAALAVCLPGCDGDDDGPYESVSIGGNRWMTKNLDIETGNSWCYDNNPENCAIYGRLYDWNTAKTACPSGWKLPDTTDWGRLVDEAGGKYDAGKKLKSLSGWDDYGNGTDYYGFAALPGGHRNSGGKFNNIGKNGVWWTATDRGGYAYVRDINNEFDDALQDTRVISSGLSVRCVKR